MGSFTQCALKDSDHIVIHDDDRTTRPARGNRTFNKMRLGTVHGERRSAPHGILGIAIV